MPLSISIVELICIVLSVYLYIYTHVHMCVYIYTRSYIYIYVYTCVHVYTYARRKADARMTCRSRHSSQEQPYRILRSCGEHQELNPSPKRTPTEDQENSNQKSSKHSTPYHNHRRARNTNKAVKPKPFVLTAENNPKSWTLNC